MNPPGTILQVHLASFGVLLVPLQNDTYRTVTTVTVRAMSPGLLEFRGETHAPKPVGISMKQTGCSKFRS
jgi:hypothetical protein